MVRELAAREHAGPFGEPVGSSTGASGSNVDADGCTPPRVPDLLAGRRLPVALAGE